MAQRMNGWDYLTAVLMIVGALNWGFAVFNFNLVEALFSSFPAVKMIIYSLIGISGAYWIYRMITLVRK